MDDDDDYGGDGGEAEFEELEEEFDAEEYGDEGEADDGGRMAVDDDMVFDGATAKQPFGVVDPSKIPIEQRKTSRYLSKYERARILGLRARQLSLNAPVMIPYKGDLTPLEVATLEFQAGKLPFIIRRYLPNGSYEDWRVNELIPYGSWKMPVKVGS